ncbi:type II toxin-antitoxin system ParD family antitoxin [Microbacterium istanbulense]|uniref:Type II toxin-antitoxin system ParD family antitoxin n=1 Tax=Microbacterium istanbulense TaxID=3122049 RepID=A0ABU8LKB3_9MICO
MSTMNVSLPASMRDYVDQRVAQANYGSASEYVRDLIRRDQARSDLRERVLLGAESPLVTESTEDLFTRLRGAAGA